MNSRILTIALLFMLTVSLTLYFLPIHRSPPIAPGVEWRYYYREIMTSGGKMVYEVEATLDYSATDLSGADLIVKLSNNFKQRYFSESDSEPLASNGTEMILFRVNILDRKYPNGVYTSWWIPTDIFIGSSVVIWNLEFHVRGLSWAVVDGKLVECWLLEYRGDLEEYTILYERTTGLFVRFSARRSIGASHILMERWLERINVGWPILSLIRPLLIFISLASLAALLFLLARKIRERLRRFRAEPTPLIY
ncbi:MAG: hypothetical protein QW600_01165 [Candidatus Bathyarchaeia archaeon]|nr:hypothetical protein [Candidatus Bathyarchaeota archaeon]